MNDMKEQIRKSEKSTKNSFGEVFSHKTTTCRTEKFLYFQKLFEHALISSKTMIVITILALCMSTNMLLGSENIIANGSFEDGKQLFPSGWKIGGAWSRSSSRGIGKFYFWDKDIRKNGTCSMYFYTEKPSDDFGEKWGKYLSVAQTVDVSGGKIYNFSFWVKGEDVSKKKEIGVVLTFSGKGKFKCRNYYMKKISSESNFDWKEVKDTFLIPKGVVAATVHILMNGRTTSGKIWFDDFTLRESSENSQYRNITPFPTKFDRQINVLEEDLSKNNRQIYALYCKPEIDGKLSDPCWEDATPISDFMIPAGEKPAKEQTIVRLCYDDKNLYLAFKALTAKPAKLKAAFHSKERDKSLWYDDCIELYIYSEQKKASVHFIVNSKGAKWDGIHRGSTKDVSWNPAWSAATSLNHNSWSTEISIPLSELESVLGTRDSWTINLCRENKVIPENSCTSFLPLSRSFLTPLHFSRLLFCKDKKELPGKDVFSTKITRLHELRNKQIQSVISDSRKQEYIFKYAFDFGKADSSLKEGFKSISPTTSYTPLLGYGWIKNSKMKASNRGANKKTGSPNSLTCDFIEGEAPAQFQIDMPDGRYVGYLICGDTRAPAPVFEVYSNNQKLADIAVGGRYNFQAFSFPITVTDGKLVLKFKGEYAWLINALIVYSEKDTAKASKELTKIKRSIYLGTPEYIQQFGKYEYNETNTLDKELRAKDYVVFFRNYLNIVFPNTIPVKEDFKNKLSIFATPGEYEPATFSILPLKGLKNVEISVGNLLTSDGKSVIDSKDIEVRRVKYLYSNVTRSRPARYIKFPRILEKYTVANLPRGEATRYWLTVKVPENASPGNYQGQITIKPANSLPKVLQFKVEVLPFKLPVLKKPVFNMCYHLPVNSPRRGIDGWKLIEKDLIDMKKHNMNSVNLFPIPNNPWNDFGTRRKSISVKGLLRFLRLCKKAGLTEPVPIVFGSYLPWSPSQSHKKEELSSKNWQYVIEASRELDRCIKKEGLPKIWWYVDESYNEVRKNNMITFFKFMKKNCPFIKTFITSEYSPFPYADVLCHGNIEKFLIAQPDYVKKMKKNNVSIWTYNKASNSFIPSLVRFGTGFNMWRWQLAGQLNFTYQLYYYHGNPYNPLDNTVPMYGHTFPGTEGPIPTVSWEAIREGIDDLRYIKTLEKVIAQTGANSDAQKKKTAKKAGKFLAELKSNIPIENNKQKFSELTGQPLPVDGQLSWENSSFDRYRRKIANFIIKLQQ